MEKRLPQGGRIMDKKRRLIKLYEAEIEKISDIRADIDSLKDMSDEYLIALIGKAQKFHRIFHKTWEEICRNDIEIDAVKPIFIYRKELEADFAYINRVEKDIKKLKQEIKEDKKELKIYNDKYEHSQKLIRNKLILFLSFAVMFLCAIVFQITMFRLYHDIWIPSLVLMLALPLALCGFYGFSLMRLLDQETENEELEIENELQFARECLQQRQEEIEFFDIKYRNVFQEIDEYQLQAYPYVEKILRKMEYREEYRKAKNEYQGIMELEQFKRPEIYLYIPEIFLIEEAQDTFMNQIKEKMRKIDEYLVQTIETD